MIQTILDLTNCPTKTVITIELPESKREIVENYLDKMFTQTNPFKTFVGEEFAELKNTALLFIPEEGLIKIIYKDDN